MLWKEEGSGYRFSLLVAFQPSFNFPCLPIRSNSGGGGDHGLFVALCSARLGIEEG